jgi:6-phosphogluconolactonase
MGEPALEALGMSEPHHREIVRVADPEALAHRAADWMVSQLGGAGEGPLSVCLSGGSTPKRLYQRLARSPRRDAMPWSRLHWFWGDERFVPPDDERSNARMAREALLDQAPVSPDHIHPIPVDAASPETAATAYEATLRSFYGSDRLDPARPLFDIMLLGIGSDGHTASLFPGKAAVEETQRWVTAAEPGLEPFVPRVSLTLPAIAASRAVVFLVAGADKTEALRRIFAGDDLASARVCRLVPTLWFIDEAALQDLA